LVRDWYLDALITTPEFFLFRRIVGARSSLIHCPFIDLVEDVNKQVLKGNQDFGHSHNGFIEIKEGCKASRKFSCGIRQYATLSQNQNP
jgi:hypothetical protein